MSPTKTEKALSVADAVADLEAARAEYDAAVGGVIAGNSKVTAKDVAEAEDAVDFAELRLKLAHETQTHGAEERRQRRIAELVQTVKTGAVADKGRQVVTLEAQAIAAVEALYLAAANYKTAVSATSQELGRIGDLPDNVEVEWTNHQPGSFIVDGVRVEGSYNIGDWPGDVLLGALHRALEPHYGSLGDRAKPLANNAARALAGGIHQPGITAAEQLAQQVARLADDAR